MDLSRFLTFNGLELKNIVAIDTLLHANSSSLQRELDKRNVKISPQDKIFVMGYYKFPGAKYVNTVLYQNAIKGNIIHLQSYEWSI